MAASVKPDGATGAGWFADPDGRHAWRWWDGSRWTEHVSNTDGTAGVDAVPTKDGAPPASSALAAELQAALDRCQQLIADCNAERIDKETFRREIFKAGLIVHDTDAWLFDFANGRWVHYDGFGLRPLTPPPIGA